MTTSEDVTAIIVVHRWSDSASTAVDSVLSDSRSDVIVVDNGCDRPDRVIALANDRVRIVRTERNRGFAAAVNFALADVDPTHHVLLLNDDACLEDQCLRTLVDTLNAAPGDVVSVGPLVVLADQPHRVDSLGVVLRGDGAAFNAHIGSSTESIGSEVVEVLSPCFSVALIRAGAFDHGSVGLLDERFFLYYEDLEWAVRARHRGLRHLANPQARARHVHAATTRTLGEANRFRIVQRNLLIFATMHLSWRGASRVWARQLVTQAKGLITGPYRVERIRAIGAALGRLPSALRARRRARGRTPVGDEALISFSEGHQSRFDTGTYRAPD